MPTHPADAAGFKALRRFGDPGKSEAVCPSSPMPSTVTSNGRGTRAKVSHADTAPKSGDGAAFFKPTKRAAAARSLSNTSRTSFSLLAGSVGSTQRSSASATQTRLQSSGCTRKCSNSFTGELPPDTTRLARPRSAIAFSRLTAMVRASWSASVSASGNRWIEGGVLAID